MPHEHTKQQPTQTNITIENKINEESKVHEIPENPEIDDPYFYFISIPVDDI